MYGGSPTKGSSGSQGASPVRKRVRGGKNLLLGSAHEFSLQMFGKKDEGYKEKERIESGGYFGEQSILLDRKTTDRCEAVTECKLATISKSDYSHIIEQVEKTRQERIINELIQIPFFSIFHPS